MQYSQPHYIHSLRECVRGFFPSFADECMELVSLERFGFLTVASTTRSGPVIAEFARENGRAESKRIECIDEKEPRRTKRIRRDFLGSPFFFFCFALQRRSFRSRDSSLSGKVGFVLGVRSAMSKQCCVCCNSGQSSRWRIAATAVSTIRAHFGCSCRSSLFLRAAGSSTLSRALGRPLWHRSDRCATRDFASCTCSPAHRAQSVHDEPKRTATASDDPK